MANLIDNLRDSRDSYVVQLRALLIAHTKNPETLFCVYEGEDAKYYGIRIDHFTDFTNWRSFSCKGKKEVLKLHTIVMKDRDLREADIAFFVDHDFNGLGDDAPSNKLYMTPCYSIENLYIRDSVVRKIVNTEFGVNDFKIPDEINGVIYLYNQMLSEFTDAITLLNAWIVIQRNNEDPSARINLNGRKLKHFVSIELGKVERIYAASDLKTLFPKAVDVTIEELNSQEATFQDEDRINVLRGKYFIEFLRVFFHLLKEDRQSESPHYFREKGKVKLSLTKDNILSELSQYADTPSCLILFLQGLNKTPPKALEHY